MPYQQPTPPNRCQAQASPHYLPVNNHPNYYEQNQSPVYSNYVNYSPAQNHQNGATHAYQQQMQQPYYNQNPVAPQTSMHYQTPAMDNQNEMYRSQQQQQQHSRFHSQPMPQHHANLMPPVPVQAPAPAPPMQMQMQYQDSNYQSHVSYASPSASNHDPYQYPMQPTASSVPVSSNVNYNSQPVAASDELSVTETRTMNSFADDIEEQIEASTIVLKNGADKLQKITIKYRKEKNEMETQSVPPKMSKTPKTKKSKKPKANDKNRTSTKPNADSESENSTFMHNDLDDPFTESNDSLSTPSLARKASRSRKPKAKTPKFEPTYLQDDESCSNSDFTTLYGKYSNEATDGTVSNDGTKSVRFNFSGATSTPIRNNNNLNSQSPCSSAKPSYKSNESSSKSSTPRNTYKSLRRRTSNISLLNGTLNENDDSMTSFSMVEPNSFFEAESNDELNQQRLDKAIKIIETHFKKDHIDPFSSELCKAFLTKASFPSREHNEFYKLSNTLLSKLSNTRTALIGDVRFNVEKEIGRGAYGNVYRGINANTNDVVALKYQKPPNTWELYICFEVHRRIKNQDLVSFKDVFKMYQNRWIE